MRDIGSKGQAGPLGEDLISIVVAVLSITAVLTTLNYFLSNKITDSMETRMYEKSWLLAELTAARWSNNQSYARYTRVLDASKICSECIKLKGYETTYTVEDLIDGKTLCSCGTPVNESMNVRLPVAIKTGNNKIHPGTINVYTGK
ncbi:MAG: hypothetical protein B6U72_06375 [Candidatus Altiarchaeales archaeon ex4484_2]|nr:MAG: hypothetical protein B6U72_06375 [Candidatus Altiarchaeales archaeon ex4484_2]